MLTVINVEPTWWDYISVWELVFLFFAPVVFGFLSQTASPDFITNARKMAFEVVPEKATEVAFWKQKFTFGAHMLAALWGFIVYSWFM